MNAETIHTEMDLQTMIDEYVLRLRAATFAAGHIDTDGLTREQGLFLMEKYGSRLAFVIDDMRAMFSDLAADVETFKKDNGK